MRTIGAMRIGGLHKTTLMDFPGRVSALVFTQGCNFRCPYCHNPTLVRDAPGQETAAPGLGQVLDFLARRATVLQGVVISGGEPTLQKGLPDFCALVKSLGYLIKLDTNGSRPEILAGLLEAAVVDYIAMDLKADPARYPEAISPAPLGDALFRSIRLLGQSGLPHEFRVTCAAPFITPGSFDAILTAVNRQAPIFLQKVRPQQVLDPAFFPAHGRALDEGEVNSFRERAEARGQECRIR